MHVTERQSSDPYDHVLSMQLARRHMLQLIGHYDGHGTAVIDYHEGASILFLMPAASKCEAGTFPWVELVSLLLGAPVATLVRHIALQEFPPARRQAVCCDAGRD